MKKTKIEKRIFLKKAHPGGLMVLFWYKNITTPSKHKISKKKSYRKLGHYSIKSDTTHFSIVNT